MALPHAMNSPEHMKNLSQQYSITQKAVEVAEAAWFKAQESIN